MTMGEGSVTNIGDPQRCCGVSGWAAVIRSGCPFLLWVRDRAVDICVRGVRVYAVRVCLRATL